MDSCNFCGMYICRAQHLLSMYIIHPVRCKTVLYIFQTELWPVSVAKQIGFGIANKQQL